MEWLRSAIDFVLHIDKHLAELIAQVGPGVYGILFLIVFCETGLVIMPFLPGDSLLFATGVLASRPEMGLDVRLVSLVFIAAAFCGDNVNYWIGRTIGRRASAKGSRLLKPEHLAKTQAFMGRHGPKAIIIARFVPIVRTCMPFVAGMGEMPYGRFISWSIGASLIWVGVCVYAGYFFGNVPFVRDNFSVAVLTIIGVTLIPVVIEVIRHRMAARAERSAPHSPS